MLCPDPEAMLWIAGRWWWFPHSRISEESEFEWKNHRVYLLRPDGSTVEGVILVGDVELD